MINFRLVTMYLGLMLAFLSSLGIYMGVIFYLKSKVIFVEWEIFSLYGSSMVMILLMDWMSLTFLGFVMLISSMVLFYSSSYMGGDKFMYRFIMLVFLFVVSMLLMILSPNLISILLGWDGLGLVSYLLVIYYQNVKSSNAGMLTVLSNRVGDVAILLSIAWLATMGTWNFHYIQYFYLKDSLILLLFLVVLAAMTKSAQIPFSAWLPAAMAAPTPVSALVHSSTLVTAGVYLLIRFSYLLGYSSMLFYIGSFTMFMSGLGANYENDLKKIIALSTLSQLGLMMMILSLGMPELAFFHLLSHALFKSLLFLCAGVFIHGMSDMQDIRFLGGTHVMSPVSSMYFMGCSMSLCGFPFLSGFYSKDTILEIYMMNSMGLMMCCVVVLATVFTATYSLRLSYYLFFKNLGSKFMYNLSDEMMMIFPMSVLFFLMVFAGSGMSWFYFPIFGIYLSLFFKCLIIFSVFFCGAMAWILMSFVKLSVFKFYNKIYYYLGSMWFMPLVSTFGTSPSLKLGGLLIKYFDQGWVEYMGGQGSHMVFSKSSLNVDLFHFLNLKTYLFIFFIMLIFFSLL